MAKFIYFTPEEKARAQNTDLVSLLRAQGERPIRSGREYRIPITEIQEDKSKETTNNNYQSDTSTYQQKHL